MRINIIKSPHLVFYYFVLLLRDTFIAFLHTITPLRFILAIISLLALYPLSILLQPFHTTILYNLYWLGLGVLSSIGLGTGLPTFVLFLAPFLVKSTIDSNDAVLVVWHKTIAETMLWGMGTALGELPPYFIARAGTSFFNAASAAGREDADISLIESILSKKVEKRSWDERLQIFIYRLVTLLGFWGILVAASVPNPLFDLAGIVCGRFGVGFWTFFGATLVGKAVVKCNMQAIFVIAVASEDVLGWIKIRMSRNSMFLTRWMEKLLSSLQDGAVKEQSRLAFVWNSLLMGMIVYFLVSTIESLADAKRLKEEKKTN